jgi:hypothetical protein
MLNIPGHKGNANQNDTEIPPHSSHQEHKQQMLARMWGKKKKPYTLLVGM